MSPEEASILTGGPPGEQHQRILRFLSVHRLALDQQIRMLLGGDESEAVDSLAVLEASGLARRERVGVAGPDGVQVSQAGLAAIGSDLPPPTFDPRYRHNVGVAWLWLAASRGAFGRWEQIMTERETRAADRCQSPGSGAARSGGERGPDASVASRFGIRIPVDGRRPELHYPDLLLIGAEQRVAVELQLGFGSPGRLSGVLTGYAADRRIAAAVFLVVDPGVGDRVQAVAARLGVSRMIQVQPATLG